MQRGYIQSAWWLLSGFSIVTRIQGLLYTIFQELVGQKVETSFE